MDSETGNHSSVVKGGTGIGAFSKYLYQIRTVDFLSWEFLLFTLRLSRLLFVLYCILGIWQICGSCMIAAQQALEAQAAATGGIAAGLARVRALQYLWSSASVSSTSEVTFLKALGNAATPMLPKLTTLTAGLVGTFLSA